MPLKAVVRRGAAARKALVNRRAEAIGDVRGWMAEGVRMGGEGKSLPSGMMRENIGGAHQFAGSWSTVVIPRIRPFPVGCMLHSGQGPEAC